MAKKTGKRLEKKVFANLRRLLNSGRLPLNPQNCEVHHQKKYFSKDRNANVQFDVSLEIFQNAPNDAPISIWFFECKDYGGAVGVEDVEEFHTKLQQVGADNSTGFMVTPSKFGKAAKSFAKSNGINLAIWAETDKRRVLLTAEFAKPIDPSWLPFVLVPKNELSMLLGTTSPVESVGLLGLKIIFSGNRVEALAPFRPD